MTDNTIISFEPNEELQTNTQDDMSTYIKIIGVGGGGCNAVKHMYNHGITGVEFIVCNTDRKSLLDNPVPKQIQLGNLGAGNNPERAKKRALEHKDEIRSILQQNTRMLFITAGMGGGTGTGVAPVIAEIAKSITVENDDDIEKILVVGVVTFPFLFEGPKRLRQAEAGIAELRKHVDSILIINNEKLRDFGNETLSETYTRANDVLLTAAKSIAEIITVTARISIDFQDVNTVMQNSGTALMGIGRASGPNRAEEAIKMASESPLLNDNNIAGAKNILLFLSYSPEHEVKMDELSIVTQTVTTLTGDRDTDVIWGEGPDDSLQDELVVTLIATGFDKKQTDKGTQIPFTTPTPPTTKDFDDTNNGPNTGNDFRAPETPANGPSTENTVTDSLTDGITLVNPNKQDTTETATPSNTDSKPETTSKGNVYTLEDDKTNIEPKEIIPEANTPLQQEEGDDIFIYKSDKPIHHEPEKEIKPQPIQNNIEFMAMSRAERITRIHEQLKNNPEAVNQIENTPATELLGIELPNMNQTISEVRNPITINSNGEIVSNKYIDQIVD